VSLFIYVNLKIPLNDSFGSLQKNRKKIKYKLRRKGNKIVKIETQDLKIQKIKSLYRS
jgi:hypothetical protein